MPAMPILEMKSFSLPNNCDSATDFCHLMERIWDGDLGHLYYQYENALSVARLYAKHLYPGRHNGDAGGQIFLFADGSPAWVKRSECARYAPHTDKR